MEKEKRKQTAGSLKINNNIKWKIWNSTGEENQYWKLKLDKKYNYKARTKLCMG